MTATPLAEILALHQRGFALIPVPFRQHHPVLRGWQHLRLDDAGLRQAFAGRSNVGLLLGEPSGGVVDVDLDAPEARFLADAFLPPTDLVSGRPSSPASHRYYRVKADVRTTQFRDPRTEIRTERAMLVELRSTGCQTLVPPSVHPSGEPVSWLRDGDPAAVEADELEVAVARLAAASLLARAWPAIGSRHDAALGLAGGLLRAGWDPETVAAFVGHVARAAGDEEVEDRVRAVQSTANALAAGQHTTGWPTLGTLVDARVVSKVREWLGIRGDSEVEDTEQDGTVQAAAHVPAEQRARMIPVPPFPLEVFPAQVARYLADGATTVGCPVDLIAVPFLSYAAAAVGRQRKLAIKRRWVRKTTLWTGVVATSGSAKSPADGYARHPLDILQAEADERYAEQFTVYKRDLARWKGADPGDRGDEPSPPLYEHWYTTDPTVESLAPMLQTNAGVAAAFDELVAWARGCNAYKKGGNDRQKYLELWNGRPLKVDRRTQGVLYVPDPVCCLAGGIQPERLPELTREASVHDGLLQRFCWTYPDVPAQGWSWEERESDDLEAMVALMRRLRSSPPLVLCPHPGARERWATWYDTHKASLHDLPPLAREMASKHPAHLATLWLVLQCLHDPEGRHGEALPQHLEAAIALLSYFQAHARRVLIHFGSGSPPVETRIAARVAAVLQRTDGWLGQTELWQALHRNVTAADLNAALDALLASGKVVSRIDGVGPARRTLWRWMVTDEDPAAAGAQADPGFGTRDFLNSYESTNHAPGPGTDSFDSYEPGATMPSQRTAGPDSGRLVRPDTLSIDDGGDAGGGEETCCLCGAPLPPGHRYQCGACAAEGES